MPLYEHVCVTRQELSSNQVNNLMDRCGKILTDNGGTVVGSEYWGSLRLAYKIKKNRKGHYFLLKIDSPSSAVQELERLMRINDSVIRFLTVRVEEHKDGPSPIDKVRRSRN
ncbi:MAG: 30S ribosomal protein S6 [Rhodobacteraceae bacterium]|nr:30S ribosomal protein S6 [Paracoccaceae bacterium]